MKQLNIDINRTFGEVITDMKKEWNEGDTELKKEIKDTLASGTNNKKPIRISWI